jgi:hypothetical protein
VAAIELAARSQEHAMSLDITNLAFSLVILQQRRVDRARALAASVGAALIPGPTGLVVPAIVAAGTRPSPGGTLPPPTDTGVVKVKVPDVVGQAEAAAVQAVRDADLTPVTSATFSAPADEVGQVVDQDPAGDEYAATGSVVDMTIARAPDDEEKTESEKEDEILKVVHQIAEKVGIGSTPKSGRRRYLDPDSPGTSS